MHARKEPKERPRWSMLALAAIVAVSVYALLDWRRGESPAEPSVAELADPRAEVRIEALERVGAAWPAGARLAPLLPDLIVGDPDPAVQQAARRALDSLRKPALAWYVQLLEDVEEERLPAVAERTREFDRLGVRASPRELMEALSDMSPAQPRLLLSGLPWFVDAHFLPHMASEQVWAELALLERMEQTPGEEREGLAAGLVLVASGETRRRSPTPATADENDPSTHRLLRLLVETRHRPWMSWSVLSVLGTLASPAPRALADLERTAPASAVRENSRLRQVWAAQQRASGSLQPSGSLAQALAAAELPARDTAEGMELEALLDLVRERARWGEAEALAARRMLLDVLRADAKLSGELGRTEAEGALRALVWMPALDRAEASVVEAMRFDVHERPSFQPLLRLALLALSERGRAEDLHSLLAQVDELGRSDWPGLARPRFDWDVQHALTRALSERSDLAIEGGLLLESVPASAAAGETRLHVAGGLSRLAPGPARDEAIAVLASGRLAWREAAQATEQALAEGRLRALAQTSLGEIVQDLTLAMSVLEALWAWGPASGVPASSIASLRDARNPRLAWRAHRAYRALGGT